MMTPWVEYCLWALAGALAGAGLTAWLLHGSSGAERRAIDGGDPSETAGLTEHQRAWEAFASCAIPMIPVLMKQLEGVTQQTERAMMDLMVGVRSLSTPPPTATPETQAADLSKVVMAMQFQDITQQKLGHVTQALEQLRQHLQALLKGPQDEGARQAIVALQQLEQSYTTADERRLHAATLTPDYQEPVPIETERTEEESDSVTLF